MWTQVLAAALLLQGSSDFSDQAFWRQYGHLALRVYQFAVRSCTCGR
jgi:hypothetical protein